MVTTSPAEYRVISAAEAASRFAVEDDVAYPFDGFADEQEIRLYEGGLRVDGDFAPDTDEDWVPFNTIVAGDLHVTGTLDWRDSGSGNFFLVTGDVTAANVVLVGCPDVVVRGDLTVTGGIQGSYGDDGGVLTVGGRTRARVVISTLYFCMYFGEQPEALYVGDTYRTDRPVDFSADELAGIVRPELLGRGGTPDEHAIGAALRAGRPVLRDGVVPARKVALEELRNLLDDPGAVTDLDLADRKLRGFPAEVLEFRNLRRLSLAGNEDLGDLDERIGGLAALEELDLSGTRLAALPDAIGALKNLRVLDISGNAFAALPDALGDLPRLEVLRASGLGCAVPDALARLGALRDLDLSCLQPGEYRDVVAFPSPVLGLTGLRTLDLSHVWLGTLPDGLTALTALEHLDLRGSLSTLVERLPDLTALPALRVLRLSGNTPWSFQPEPDIRLLDGVWGVTTLERLEIDRWGEKTHGDVVTRPGLTALPDDAFARMPGLRFLDLSFNPLTTLPESFYALPSLTAADLSYLDLDEPTRARIAATYPDLGDRP